MRIEKRRRRLLPLLPPEGRGKKRKKAWGEVYLGKTRVCKKNEGSTYVVHVGEKGREGERRKSDLLCLMARIKVMVLAKRETGP